MVFIVLMLLAMAVVLAAVFASTSSELSRDEHRAAMGDMAQVIAENMVDEAFYALWSRVNAPRESARFPVDVYRELRDAKVGEVLSFQVPPVLTWRTVLQPGVKLEPVKVQLRILELTTETSTTYRTIQQSLRGARPTPAGTPRRSCYTRNIVPVITRRPVAVGEATFRARVTLDAGAGISVTRELEVGHRVRVGRVSEKPPIAWVDVIPIREFQILDREARK